MRGAGGQDYSIDLGKTRKDAGEVVKEQVSKIVDMAKATALESLGDDDDAALRLMKKYL
jgi:hypothetical protein